MIPRIKSLWLPKKGYLQDECEDSILVHPSHSRHVDKYKFAIADGATESSFSKEWASLLTGSIQNKKDINVPFLLNALPYLQALWKEKVFSRPLPYYAEAKALQGAFSTLLTLQINIKHLNYKCIAVGDCCLFHMRDSELIKCFPFMESKEFGNNPFLISSINSQNLGLKDFIKEVEGYFLKGDQFILMSDAIACWFFTKIEQNEKPWETINNLFADKIHYIDNFINWLDEQREARAIKNDDTSIISIFI